MNLVLLSFPAFRFWEKTWIPLILTSGRLYSTFVKIPHQTWY